MAPAATVDSANRVVVIGGAPDEIYLKRPTSDGYMDHFEIANCRMARHCQTSHVWVEAEWIPQSSLLGSTSTACSTPETRENSRLSPHFTHR